MPALVDVVRHVAPLPGSFRRAGLGTDLWSDIRYSLRRIWGDRLFSATAVLAIGVGLAGTSALFTVVDTILFAPLRVEAPDRLVHIYTSSSDGNLYGGSSWGDLRHMQEAVASLDQVAGFQRVVSKVSRDDGAPADVAFSDGTWNLLAVAGVRPVLGTATPPDGGRGLVLEYRYWQREFGGRPDVLDRTLTVRGSPVPIVGVAPETFTGFTPGIVPAFWLLTDFRDHEIVDSNSRSVVTLGRLAPGGSLPALRGELDRLAADLSASAPDTHRGRRFTALSFDEVRFTPEADRILRPLGAFVFFGAALLLALVCSNLATFVLARAEDRRVEIATRLALGAGRLRILRQAGIEALVLSLAGTGVGVVLAASLVGQALGRLSLPIPVDVRIGLGGRTIAFSLAMSGVAALVFGVAPYTSTLFGRGRDFVATALRGSGASRRANRMLSIALATQVTIAVLLTVTAGVLLRSLQARGTVDPGFRHQGLGIGLVTLDADDTRDVEATFKDLSRELHARGASTVGQTSWLPLRLERMSITVSVPDVPPPDGAEGYSVTMAAADAGYFAIMGLAPVRGTTFGPAGPDDDILEIIVNRAFEARFGQGHEMVGSTMDLPGFSEGRGRTARIVGVVANHLVTGAGEAPTPVVYLSLSQFPAGRRFILVPLGSGFSLGTFHRFLQDQAGLEVHRVLTMEEHLSEALRPARALMLLFLTLALLALFLVIVGSAGAARYAVRRRAVELAIRSTLGARTRRLLADVLRDGLRPVVSGAFLGTLVSALVIFPLQGFLYGVSFTDPRVALLPLVIPVLAAVAGAVPALTFVRRDLAKRLREG